jgi:glycosyltransferase involved in cell wall biosynthesis
LNSLLQSPATASLSTQFRSRITSATVAVCTRNRPVFLQKCLAAVSRLDPGPRQVLVIDNSEGNDDTRKVANDYGARYVLEPTRGLCRARNRALAECETEIVAFLDDDVIPALNWLQQLVEPFNDPRTAASTGRVITPETLASNYHLQDRTLCNQDPHWFETAAFGGMGLGANIALRNRLCPPGTFFDERLGRGAPFEIGDESYALAALVSQGHRIVYTPYAIVRHPSLTRTSLEREERNAFTYWLLLFTRFPHQRITLLRFLLRHLRGKELEWPRDCKEPGQIVSSSWVQKFRAVLQGLTLFLRTPNPH